MPPDFAFRLRALAEVIVRVGVNLQPGQPLLITDPYDLLGLPPETETLATAVCEAAREAGCPQSVTLPADPARLRALAEADDLRAYDALVADHTRRLRAHLARGAARVPPTPR